MFIRVAVMAGWCSAALSVTSGVVAGGVIGLPARLMPSLPGETQGFGASVALSGDFAAVGSPLAMDGGAGQGAVDLFRRDAGAWAFEQRVHSNAPVGGQQFGRVLAMDGTTLVVGSPFDTGPAGFTQGSVTVFVRTGGGGVPWQFQARILAPDAGAGHHFGASAAVEGDTLIAGAPFNSSGGTSSGAAYIFTRVAGVWSFSTKLLASDFFDESFGTAAAISGDRIVIGDDSGADRGRAHVFRRVGGVWSQEALLDPAMFGDAFSTPLCLKGDVLIAGAKLRRGPSGSAQGSAFIYERGTGGWALRNEVRSPTPAQGQQFGSAVALDDGMVMVVSPFVNSSGSARGVVHVYERGESGWSFSESITPPLPGEREQFGSACAADDGVFLCGAPAQFPSGGSTGSAWVFQMRPPACPGDADGDGAVGLSDIAAVIQAWGQNVAPAGTGVDLDGSGDVGLGDIAAVVQAWGTACL
ncbi:MAG TPA: hypothetical protein VG797_11705 [Phycisphaerales bacterium]|nr:hypothetical protein [Phycisphaerales bacterium]